MGIAVTFVHIVFYIIQVLLALRFIFRFFGASGASSFTSWLYSASQPLVAPFVNVFPSFTIPPSFVLETFTLVAMIVYSCVGYILLMIARPHTSLE